MNLKEFKDHIEKFADGYVFDFTLSRPFSWRGIYAEVAFAIEKEPSTKEQVLESINEAYSNEFYGYKGGYFYYDDRTDVHFESDSSSYTDGDYVRLKISEIEERDYYPDEETRLITLAFK